MNMKMNSYKIFFLLKSNNLNITGRASLHLYGYQFTYPPMRPSKVPFASRSIYFYEAASWSRHNYSYNESERGAVLKLRRAFTDFPVGLSCV